MISVDLDDSEVVAALTRLRDRMGERGMTPALAAIGERLSETTRQRFASGTAPDGTPWAPDATATLLRRIRKNQDPWRPLVATGWLARSIRYQNIPGGVAVGTDRLSDHFPGGAAVHQFGSRDGHIPARPFLGLSDNDRGAILEIVAQHLGR